MNPFFFIMILDIDKVTAVLFWLLKSLDFNQDPKMYLT